MSQGAKPIDDELISPMRAGFAGSLAGPRFEAVRAADPLPTTWSLTNGE